MAVDPIKNLNLGIYFLHNDIEIHWVFALRRRQMTVMASRITGQSSVCWAVFLDWQQRHMKGPRYYPFDRTINLWQVDSPQNGRETRKMFPIEDVIMSCRQQDSEKPSAMRVLHLYKSSHFNPKTGSFFFQKATLFSNVFPHNWDIYPCASRYLVDNCVKPNAFNFCPIL